MWRLRAVNNCLPILTFPRPYHYFSVLWWAGCGVACFCFSPRTNGGNIMEGRRAAAAPPHQQRRSARWLPKLQTCCGSSPMAAARPWAGLCRLLRRPPPRRARRIPRPLCQSRGRRIHVTPVTRRRISPLFRDAPRPAQAAPFECETKEEAVSRADRQARLALGDPDCVCSAFLALALRHFGRTLRRLARRWHSLKIPSGPTRLIHGLR